MILKDKPYIKTPTSNTPLIHYLNIYQLLSILKYKKLVLSTVGSYNDREEATLTLPSYEKVKQHLLWEDNTPVQKEDTGYTFARETATKSKTGWPEEVSERLYEDYWNKIWTIDTFEHLIHSFTKHFMFTHCWSISDTENILMWDRYRHQEATVAIKTVTSKIENALSKSEYPLYIGKIQYKNYETEHIAGFQEYPPKNLSDPNTIEELFYQPVLHKQNLYKSENEVRIITSYKHTTKSLVGKTYLTNIPFYDRGEWGFYENPDRHKGAEEMFVDNQSEKTEYYWVPKKVAITVDTNELIEQIILSPYTEPYVLPLIQDMTEYHNISRNKVTNSSINIRN